MEKHRGAMGIASSALHSKAMACLRGLQWASLGLSSIQIHTDSTNLVLALQKTRHNLHNFTMDDP